MTDSRAKLNEHIEDANRSFNAENDSMNEWHERIKTQEVILNKRTEIHVRLPTNQVVTPAHNALVEEDVKEGILIAESFKAVKDEKANMRAKLAIRLEKVEEAHIRECAALNRQIACLRDVAELSGVDLDDTEVDEHTLYESAAPVIRIQSSTPAQFPPSTRSKQSNPANTNKRQKLKGPVINVLAENCYNCGRLQEEMSTVSTTKSNSELS